MCVFCRCSDTCESKKKGAGFDEAGVTGCGCQLWEPMKINALKYCASRYVIYKAYACYWTSTLKITMKCVKLRNEV